MHVKKLMLLDKEVVKNKPFKKGYLPGDKSFRALFPRIIEYNKPKEKFHRVPESVFTFNEEGMR